MKQIPINGTSDRRISPCVTSHYAKIGVYDLFHASHLPAFAVLVIKDKEPGRRNGKIYSRYALGASNAPEGFSRDFHANPYFSCVVTRQSGTRQQLIAEISEHDD